MSDPRALYRERLERVERAVALERVDRPPVIFMGTAFAPRFVGRSLAEFCADPEARVEATLEAMERLGGLDGINAVPSGLIGVSLAELWLSRVELPGRELPEGTVWQVREQEVMAVEEYDAVVAEGWPAVRERLLARVLDPGELAAQRAWQRERQAATVERFRDRGFVPVSSGGTTIPFECLCGARSLREFFLDLRRRPERVKAALDAMLPTLVEAGLEDARLSGLPSVWVGGWRSASGFLSPKLWDELVWPYFVRLVSELAAAGVRCVLHFDQDWTRDLARLRELPARSCILNLDGMTDIRLAKELLGDRMALMGDVPASLLALGDPDGVGRYVRELVRDCGPTGLLVCAGCDIPIDAKPENVEALVEAVAG